MGLYVILSRISPDAFNTPADFKNMAMQVSERIQAECPGVTIKESFSTLGRFDFVDIVEADDPLQVEKAEKYSIEIEVATDRMKEDAEYAVSVGDVELPCVVKPTGGPKDWKKQVLGSIELPAGKVEFKLECKSIVKKGVVKISAIALKPVE